MFSDQSPPPVSLLGLFPDPRKAQVGLVLAVVVAESLRQKLGLAYPWAGGGGGDTSHQRRHKQANLFAQVPTTAQAT